MPNAHGDSRGGTRPATEQNIAKFLNRMLNIRTITDASKNGLQVGTGKTIVNNVGFAVDACLSTFQKALKKKVDLLVVHHGIKWKHQKDQQTVLRREAFLRQHGMALYAVHLPLDLHPRYGNNSELCRMLGMSNLKKFGRYHGIRIGFRGSFVRKKTPQEIAALLERKLTTHCRVYSFGPSQIQTLGIVSGGGGGMLPEAIREGLDGFLVGEIDLGVYNAARENRVNIIVAGHYATETTGVRALMPLVAEAFSVKTTFIDDPKDL